MFRCVYAGTVSGETGTGNGEAQRYFGHDRRARRLFHSSPDEIFFRRRYEFRQYVAVAITRANESRRFCYIVIIICTIILNVLINTIKKTAT